MTTSNREDTSRSAEIKEHISASRLAASLAANRAMTLLYWRVGTRIAERLSAGDDEAMVIDQVSTDLRAEFKDVRGFSAANLRRMVAFARAWPDERFVDEWAAKLPWLHNCLLVEKVDDLVSREWYIRMTIERGWGHATLAAQIEAQAYQQATSFDSLYDAITPANRVAEIGTGAEVGKEGVVW